MRSPAAPTLTTPLRCCVEGCDEPVKVTVRMLCGKHYNRWQRHGDPNYVPPAHFYGTTLERFWHYADQQPDGHWMWTGPKNSPEDSRAYGLLFDSDLGRNVLAHRYSYELHKGPIPEGTEPDHTCEVVMCVAPDHLEAVSHKVNVQRGQRWREHRRELPPLRSLTCTIDDCEEPQYVRERGWCRVHYDRWRRRGDPLLRSRRGRPWR